MADYLTDALGDGHVAAAMLADAWPGARAELISVSENSTFRVHGGPEPAVLRVHRPGYQTPRTIAAELDWLAALRSVPGLDVVEPLTAAGRDRILTLRVDGAERYGVLFAELDGAPVDQDGLGEAHFGELGGIAARLHAHAARWRPPPGFERFAWGLAHTLGPGARWGDWRRGPGVTARLREVIAPGADLLARRLAAFGTGDERFGLIHADLRTSNLIPRGPSAPGVQVQNPGRGEFTVIDFDDCGFGWYLYDFAAAVSFAETDPRLGEWAQRWLAGYRAVRRLDPAHVGILPSLVLLRRLMLLAWLGEHDHAVEAADDGFADGTAELAMRYAKGDRGELWARTDRCVSVIE